MDVDTKRAFDGVADEIDRLKRKVLDLERDIKKLEAEIRNLRSESRRSPR